MSPYRSSRQRRAGPQRRAGAYALYRITNLKRNRRPGIVRAPLSARLVPTPTQACYACGKAAPETGSQLSVCHSPDRYRYRCSHMLHRTYACACAVQVCAAVHLLTGFPACTPGMVLGGEVAALARGRGLALGFKNPLLTFMHEASAQSRGDPMESTFSMKALP